MNHSFFSLQTIHVAIVCAGYNASRDVVTLVKSVLFHRYIIMIYYISYIHYSIVIYFLVHMHNQHAMIAIDFYLTRVH